MLALALGWSGAGAGVADAQPATEPASVDASSSALAEAVGEMVSVPEEQRSPLLKPEELPPLDFSAALASASAAWAQRVPPAFAAPAKDLSPKSRGPVVVDWARALDAHGYSVLPPPSSLEKGGVSAQTRWPEEVDEPMAAAIAAAQADYGLIVDGKAGAYLRENLNANPLSTSAEFDAWRQTVDAAARDAWEKGYRRVVFVNIPSFTLHAIDLWTGETALESRVIIGMPTRKTPRFTTHIVGLKYNPDWSPPPSLQARGRHYMPPGVKNPLGLLRFSTDNDRNIYLHDTDEHEIFEDTNRARSSGCIRVQSWKALAAWASEQSEEDIDAEVATRRTHNASIDPVLVITTYSLVDVVDGRAGRYVDIYGLGPMKASFSTQVLSAAQ